MDVVLAFGKVLRKMRQSASLTQEQLGLEADLRRTYISILELGQQQPSLTTLFKLANALNCSAQQIIANVEVEMKKKK